MIGAMRTLFAKIFVWFWVTIALLLSVLFVGSGMLWRQPKAMRPHPGGPFETMVVAAQEVLRVSGPEALDSMLTGMDRREHMNPVLVRDAAEARKRGLPPEVVRVAELVLQRNERIDWPRRPRMVFGYPLVGPQGEHYALVLMPRPLPRPLGLMVPLTEGGPWMLVFIVFLTGLVCLALVRALVAPVARLREATRRLAAGDLTARAGYGGHAPGDELEALAQDFDGMAERIERLVGAQRQLLRDISHELRSPLARMSVAIGLARTRTDASAQPLLDRIELESERLNELIGQLLTLTRLEGDVRGAVLERFDLVDVVAGLVEDARFEALADARTVSLGGDVEADIEAYEELVRRAIENVLRNALRYSPVGGQVEVRVAVHPAEGQVGVTVRDHGPGVPADQLEAIFRPFHRVGDARDRASGGTGLGLAIAQRAVAAHGGSIVARNADGGGLEIELRLPRAPRGSLLPA
jgi:signal transduction histidine kinase